MVKKSKSIYILGSIVIGLAAIFLVYFLLTMTGVIMVKEETIIITSGTVTAVYNGEEVTCEEVKVVGGELNKDHSIEATFTGKLTDVGTTINTYHFRIVDSLGADVTSKYKIQKLEGTITVTKRPINIRATDATKPYDGKPLKSFSDVYVITSGSLVNGHSLSVESIGEQTEAGIGKNELLYTIRDSLLTDVTHNYDVTVTPGALTVTPIQLTISSADATKFYDGKELVKDSCQIEVGELLDYDKDGKADHKLETKTISSLTEPGSIDNKFEYTIIDIHTNEDVTKNYQVIPKYGKLTVTTEKLTFTSAYLSREYTGSEIVITEFTVTPDSKTEEILAQYKYKYEVTCDEIKQTDAGEYDLTYEINVFNEEGTEITEFCAITENYGKLVIDPKPVVVKSNPIEFTYAGEFINSTKEDFTVEGLVVNHELEFDIVQHTIEDYIVALNNNKRLLNSLENIKVVDKESGKEILADNYDFDFTGLGKINIVQADLQITSGDKEKYYDKEELVFEKLVLVCGEETINSEPTEPVKEYKLEFMNGHYAMVKFTNEKNLVDVGQVQNLFEYTIYDKNDLDVSKLFMVKSLYGRLEVLPVEIEITTATTSKVYDGKPLFNDNYVISQSFFDKYGISDISELGIELKLVEHTEVTDVATGKVKNKLTIDIIDLTTNEVNTNYKLIQNSGELFITPYYIGLETKTIETTFDETQHSGKSAGVIIKEAESYTELMTNNCLATTTFIGTNHELYNKQNLFISDEWTQISIGYIPNKPLSYTIYNEAGELEPYSLSKDDASKANYIIIESFGYLSVTQPNYDLTVSPYPITLGEHLTGLVGDVTVESVKQAGLIPSVISYHGDKLNEILPYILGTGGRYEVVFGIYDSNGQKVEYANQPGLYTTTIESFKLFDTSDNEVTSYRIKTTNSYIKIYKYEVEIITKTYEKEYDGVSLVGSQENVQYNGLEAGHRIEFGTDYNSIIEIGSTYNSLNYEIYDENDNKVTDLYRVNAKWGKLIVTQRNLILDFDSNLVFELEETETKVTKEDFDNQGFTYNAYGLLNETHHLEMFESETVEGTGPVNIVSFKVVDTGGNDVTELYNLIVYNSITVIK